MAPAFVLAAGLVVLGACGGEELPSANRDRPAKTDRTDDGGNRADGQTNGKRLRRRSRNQRSREAIPGIPADATETTVVRVVDRDTVELEGLGSSRLIGVDTPEVYGGVECYGREASEFAKSHLAPGSRVHFIRGTDRPTATDPRWSTSGSPADVLQRQLGRRGLRRAADDCAQRRVRGALPLAGARRA